MQSTSFRRLVLFVIFGITLYCVYGNDGAQRLVLLAAESPLLQPWPTPVVDYPPQLDGMALAVAPQTQTVGISFLFRSPLALPTPPPDDTPPVTTLAVAGEMGSGGWLHSPATLSFLLDDDIGAGVTEYHLAGLSDWIEREYYYPPPVLAEEGIHTLEYRSFDMARNAETPQSTLIRIDRTPPQVNEPVTEGNALPNGWFYTPVTLRLSAEDGLSGLAGLEHLNNVGDWQATTAATTLARTGQNRIAWRAIDVAGNASDSQEMTVLVDLTPPTTTHTFDPPAAGAWYTQPLALTLSAVDEGAGLFATYFRFDDESSWRTYAAPIHISEDGEYTLFYYSSDRALNAETPHTITLALDCTPPTLTVSTGDESLATGWGRDQVTLTAAASDALSGLEVLAYNLDDTGWQPYTAPLVISAGDQHQVYFRASDQAGNLATSEPFVVGVDRTPPITTLHLDPAPNAAGWFNTPLQVTLVATDSETGLFQSQVQWPALAAPLVYQAPFLLAEEGVYPLTWFSLDRALNQETPHSQTIRLDRTPPSIEYAIAGEVLNGDWYGASATVHLTATDALAGVARIEYALDGAPWQLYTTPLPVTAGGMHHLQARAEDGAGNQSEAVTVRLGIDRTPPQSTLWLEGGRGPNGWYVTPVTVTITAVDWETGVDTVQVRLNNGPWQVYTAPLVVDTEGTNVLEARANDRAGNQEAAQLAVFSLDLSDPAVDALVLHGERAASGWYVSPVTLRLSGQDGESGLGHLEVRIDGQGWQRYTSDLTLATEGQHRIDYRAVDSSGRLGATQTITAWIDLTAPIIQTDFAAQMTGGAVDLTDYFVALDPESGIETMTLRLNGAPYQPRQPLPPGAYTLHVEAVNAAGLRTQQVHRFVIGGATYLPLVVQAQ